MSVAKNKDGSVELFVDVSSVRITGSVRRAWLKETYAPGTEKEIGGGTGGSTLSWTVLHLIAQTKPSELKQERFITRTDKMSRLICLLKLLGCQLLPIR